MLIESPGDYAEFLDELRAAPVFGLDTEFIRESTFRPQLCLVQCSTPERCVAIDPFTVGDLAPLIELLRDPAKEKVVHAGQQDMEIFYHEDRELPSSIFDTQIAAALVGYGESIGYSRLVEQAFGVKVDKGETYTDWSVRPLTDAQVEYALNDVVHLLPLREKLVAALEDLDRIGWLEEELERYRDPGFYVRDPRQAWSRIKGAAKLDRKALAVLRELAAWREEEAERRDRPRGRIISDGALVELARRAPRSRDGLRRIRGLHPALLSRAGDEIASRIQLGSDCEPGDLPPLPEKATRDERLTMLVELVELFLKQRAEENRVGANYITNRAELFQAVGALIAGESVDELPVFRGWRGRIFGADLRAFVAGELHLGIDPEGIRIVAE